MNKRVEFDHKNSKGKHREVLTLALLVAVLPPTWAVVSPYLGVHVGPIALITTGIYGANGNKLEDTAKISVLLWYAYDEFGSDYIVVEIILRNSNSHACRSLLCRRTYR